MSNVLLVDNNNCMGKHLGGLSSYDERQAVFIVWV
jgi:hypothetical protein